MLQVDVHDGAVRQCVGQVGSADVCDALHPSQVDRLHGFIAAQSLSQYPHECIVQRHFGCSGSLFQEAFVQGVCTRRRERRRSAAFSEKRDSWTYGNQFATHRLYNTNGLSDGSVLCNHLRPTPSSGGGSHNMFQ